MWSNSCYNATTDTMVMDSKYLSGELRLRQNVEEVQNHVRIEFSYYQIILRWEVVVRYIYPPTTPPSTPSSYTQWQSCSPGSAALCNIVPLCVHQKLHLKELLVDGEVLPFGLGRLGLDPNSTEGGVTRFPSNVQHIKLAKEWMLGFKRLGNSPYK